MGRRFVVSKPKGRGLSRRELIKTSGQVAAASALAGVAIPLVHAGESSTIQLALVGCGGRGTGAAVDAMSSRHGPTRLVAMADVFQGQLNRSHQAIEARHRQLMDVPAERRFIGFDAYRRAMDSLRPGDIVILATPPAFRWPHFAYAIERRLNVFMEKPTTVDGPSTRRMLELAQRSEQANLKVGVGLMCRHCPARRELFDRIRQGQIGDLTLMRAYRQHGPVAFFASEPRPNNISELLYQIQRFHSFLWASGGAYSDFYVHNIDEACWMKDAWPVSAKASGGRHFRGNSIDQNFDSYSVEYSFADGARFFLEGRCMTGCQQEFATYVHGTRGSAIVSTSGHSPARPRIFRGQNNNNRNNADVVWRFQGDEGNPYRHEWDHLLDAIRNNRAYNEARRGAEASLVTAMGRMAAHTGQIITHDQALNWEHELAPTVDQLTMNSEAPLRAGADGRYPVPNPGTNPRREF
jgi:predicted dehydrogenase